MKQEVIVDSEKRGQGYGKNMLKLGLKYAKEIFGANKVSLGVFEKNGRIVAMQYARKLRKGDKVAIVSLSSGMLGEEFCSHNIEIGAKRL
ncbi:GNAT family N-acetyltransferase [Lachnospiraceae bacterium HCP1S3_B8]